MCSPTALIATAVAQGMSQYNQTKQQYNSQIAEYNAQAAAAEANARISQHKQEQIADQYANKKSQINNKMKLAAGQTAAQAGASGLSLSGSALDNLSSSYRAWQDDSNVLRQNQRNDVWSEQINERNYTNQANAYRTSASNLSKQKSGALLGTILSTAANIYGIKSNYGGMSNSTGTIPNLTQGITGNMGSNQIYQLGGATIGSSLFGSTGTSKYAITYPWSNSWLKV